MFLCNAACGAITCAMTIYTVHLPPAEADIERARFVPERPSVLALAFPAIWLLWHRLWYAFAVYVLIAAIVSVLARWTGSMPIGLLAVLPGLYLFLEGRQLLRGRLERAGWRFAGVVEAGNAEEADLLFFSRRSETPAGEQVSKPLWAVPAPATSRPQEAAPSIGIFGQ